MGLVIVGALIGGVVSWVITHWYYRQSMEDSWNKEKLNNCNMDNFERHLKESEWYKRRIHNQDNWICKDDVRYQIVLDSDKARDFVEDWTEKFIKKTGKLYPAYLKIDNNIFEEISFIYVDEYRYLVPMPEIKFDETHQKKEFFWDQSKLYYLVHRIIGSKSCMEDIIKISGVVLKK